MKWLNYNHLHYFWVVARAGSVVRASEELMVSQPTISTQLRDLEKAVGHRLFDRVGRGLKLTDAGRIAFNYANEIFSLGTQMIQSLDHQSATPVLRLSVGVLDVIPKPIAGQLLAPALALPTPVRLICGEDKADRLLADLAAHRTEVVLSDAPIGVGVQLHGHNHLLAESGVSFFAKDPLARRYRKGFPRSLDGAPMLLPTAHTQVRRSIDLWLDSRRIHPDVIAEFDDSALMFWIARAAQGVFPAPTVMEEALQRELDFKVVGRTRDVRERFYAITLDESPTNPAVRAICQLGHKGV